METQTCRFCGEVLPSPRRMVHHAHENHLNASQLALVHGVENPTIQHTVRCTSCSTDITPPRLCYRVDGKIVCEHCVEN